MLTKAGIAAALARVTKSVINVCTLIVVIGTPAASALTNWPSPRAALIVSVIVGIAGTILHYYVPNTTTDPHIAQTQSVRLKAA